MFIVIYQPLERGITYYTVGPFGSKEAAGKYAKAHYNETKASHKWIVAPLIFPER